MKEVRVNIPHLTNDSLGPEAELFSATQRLEPEPGLWVSVLCLIPCALFMVLD